MDDQKIIELYFARNEQAIAETKTRYGRLLNSIAFNILGDRGAAEECESDTYVRTWNSIPPTRPNVFSAYLSKITRNLSLTRLRESKRRALISTELIFDEIAEIVPDTSGDATEDSDIRDALNNFLDSLGLTKRRVFLKRYFFMRSVKDIADDLGLSTANVKVILHRTRTELRKYLEERGIVL